MWSGGSTFPSERSAAPLVLADGYRIVQTTLVTILTGLIVVGTAVGIATDRAPRAGMALAVVLVPGWVLLVVRAARCRVEVVTAAVRIRRVFSTRVIPAQDYDGVTWNPTLFPSSGVSIAIRRKSGRPVSAPTAMGMLRNPLRPVDDEVADIAQRIAARLAGGPTEP